MSGDRETAIAQALHYHDRTKHDFNRSARGPGYMDWVNQPDPFRQYEGAPQFLLPFRTEDPGARYEDLFGAAIGAEPFSIETLSWMLECALGVSATKSAAGTSWKLRCNPSSGNLHPTEGYVILPSLHGLADAPGVYHYRADDHVLEQRCILAAETWELLAEGFPPGTFFAGLSSIHWREAWKYGERAYRYCNHDVGHALAAVRFAAAALGWRCRMLDALGSHDVSTLLGLDRAPDHLVDGPEHPDLLLAVLTRPDARPLPALLPDRILEEISTAKWCGLANLLSTEQVEWPIIGETAAACLKPRAEARIAGPELACAANSPRSADLSAGKMFRQRRSAVDMDGVTEMSREDFYLALERTLPRAGRAPFDAWGYPAEIHLGLFVHRVTGLAPGPYLLVRNPAHLDELRGAMRSEFYWSSPPSCPVELPLYHLATGDCRGLAAQISCTQDIAGAGAFSLGMLARFDAPLREHGPWFYPRLFWEAGLIGQVLYLEAEAAGLRGTGIGCYFDDPVHRVFGLTGRAFQSMYHFTVGGPVDDPRLTTLPPYPAERRARSGWV